MEVERSCENCVFFMSDGNRMVCAGHGDRYGCSAPVSDVNYDECWEMDISTYIASEGKCDKYTGKLEK